MSEERDSDVKIVLNAWKIIMIIATASGAVITGFIWLNTTFALQDELMKVKGELKQRQCQLHYTIKVHEASNEITRADEQSASLWRKMPKKLDTSEKAKLDREAIRNGVLTSEKIACIENQKVICFEDLLKGCAENPQIDEAACLNKSYGKSHCASEQLCADKVGGVWRDNSCDVEE